MKRARFSLAHIVRRGLLHRRVRSLAALLALTVSAAVATALLTLYVSLNRQLHQQFRAFGANILLTSPDGSSLPPTTLATARVLAGTGSRIAPFAYAVAQTANGEPIVVAGTDFAAAHAMDSWWQVSRWPSTQPSNASIPLAALVGVRAQEALHSADFSLTYNGHPLTLHTAATLRTGGAEDSRIVIPLSAFTAWTGQGASTLEIQAPGSAEQVEQTLHTLRASLPGVQVHAVRQLVENEGHIVDRTRSLMLSSLVLIALTVAICVLATLTASVLERRRDFALMKALGAAQHRVAQLFLLEAALLALAGAAAGYLLGSLCAFGIGAWNFHAIIPPLWQAAPTVLLLNLFVALLAAGLPMRILRTMEPAALLRGE